ncbi:metallophosphoesterase [[Hallella] seregens]|uniref:Metallophosphoesterase n=1 Tax=Hallella seregens ATCC 51272 TaxID=1336250 RepID=A0ABV5ZJ57_9BACT|nr:metallophosphoesterase [Hallella seregens]
MIARILIPIILAIVLPDLYFDQHYWKRRFARRWWWRLAWWLPGVLMLAYTVGLASIRNFAPDDLMWINVYLFLLGLVVVPKALFALCSGLGLAWCRWRHTYRNWGNLVAVGLTIGVWYMLGYGTTIGLRKLEVNHVDVYFNDLPAAFDGYRIVQFTDAHVGTFTGSRLPLLQRDLDSINAQQPDLIAFTGDLQNMRPREIHPVASMLAGLRARDGVVSVLGNHDYSEYTDEEPAVEAANRAETIALQRQCGWRLLLNEHVVIRRGRDSLVVAGEQNWEKPDSSDFVRTMQGVGKGAFVVMLQHNPKAWDAEIRPSQRVQLTLSGHVHGGQIALFGLRPTQLHYHQDFGLYQSGGSALYVSAGIGGLIPFRFGASPEIAVITLHRVAAPAGHLRSPQSRSANTYTTKP